MLDDGKTGADFSTVPAVLTACATSFRALGRRRRPGAKPARVAVGRGPAALQEGGRQERERPEVAKFRDYFEYDEPIGRVPSHRALAVFRGRGLEILEAKLVQPVEPEPGKPSLAEGKIALHLGWSHQGRKADDLIRKCVAWTWRVKLSLSPSAICSPACATRPKSGHQGVCRQPARPAAGCTRRPRVVMGLDPGIRTGVKVAVVDATGKLVDTATVYPHEPKRDWDGSLFTLAKLCEKHGVNLIAIGNGTASRETDKLAADLIKMAAKADRAIRKVVVSEAGASVYSASEYASQEMPDVDVSLRGAASHRPPPARPAGRAGEDRPQEHWRGPVPARREPERAGAPWMHGGGRLRELGGRGPEHGQRAAAGARVGPVGQCGQGRGALARGHGAFKTASS